MNTCPCKTCETAAVRAAITISLGLYAGGLTDAHCHVLASAASANPLAFRARAQELRGMQRTGTPKELALLEVILAYDREMRIQGRR